MASYFSPAQWVIRRGPARPMPTLTLRWQVFAIVPCTEAGFYVLQQYVWRIPSLSFLVATVIIKVLVAIMVLYSQGLGLKALGLSNDRIGREVLVGLMFSIVYIAIFMVNNTLAGSPPDIRWLLRLLHDFSYPYALEIARWAGKLFVKAFVVGVQEELVFRGWMLTFLLTRWGVGEKALGVSALFFGLGHFHLGWWALIVTTCFGYLYGLVYLWRKNLVVPIILHILWNWAVWLGVLGRPS